MSLNSELAALFLRFSQIFEIRGEPVFKSIAFSRVSRILDNLPFDVRDAVKNNTLDQIEGIGASSRKIITDYVNTGRSPDFDEVATSVPSGLLQLLEFPGLGPKTISLFWKQRGITSLDELVKALDSGALEGLKGIGEKKLKGIRDGITMRSQAARRMGIGDAQPIAESLLSRLRALPQVKQAEIAGSLRRRRDTVGDVDLVCSLKSRAAGEDVSGAFVKFPEVVKINGQGATKASVVTAGGLQVDLRIVPEENYGAALLYFTGSKDHNVKIRGLAQDTGMTLNEWGLYQLDDYEKAEKKTGEPPKLKPLASRTEGEVYAKLGMPLIDPELREDRGEVEAALAKRLPQLIGKDDIRGDLHTHTTASDGTASIEEMADAAKAMGYEFLAITDHSKSQVIANGLTKERLLRHVEAIQKASARIKGIALLAGCEVDILVDGRLDFEDDVLKELDFVVASPHVSLKQDSIKATDRILRAIDNRYVNVIGHPTGRLINAREGLPLDFGRVFKAAAESGTALEINSGYPRLDLNDVNARGAVEAGCVLSINTDAHSTGEFPSIAYGLQVARRAWVTKDRVINCWPLKDLRAWVRKKRG